MVEDGARRTRGWKTGAEDGVKDRRVQVGGRRRWKCGRGGGRGVEDGREEDGGGGRGGGTGGGGREGEGQ